MKIGMSLLVLLLVTGIFANAQASPDLPPQPDPICQITNLAWEAVDVVHIYELPYFDSPVIGILKQNETIESDGFIRTDGGVWFVVDHAGATGFIFNGAIWVPPNCPPATVPGLPTSTLATLDNEPLLAYVSSRGGENEVYLWDGERSVNISPSPGSRAEQPIWSHQGELAWVAYALNPIDSDVNGIADILIWDGQQTYNLDLHLGVDLAPNGLPAWSHDGRLAWSGGRSENTEIYVWDGEQIINVSQNTGRDTMPTWSSDGHLAWTSERDGNAEIYVWDGEQIMNISQNPDGDDSNATWSDDGRLAWDGTINGNLEVLVWDDEQIINISQHDDQDDSAVWSADGQLAWVATRDDFQIIYVWDGENSFRVSEPGGNTINLSWSIDDRLAWHSERDLNYDFHSFGNYDIYIWDREHVINFGQSIALDAPMWNADGWLAWIANGWDIAVWDGEQIINVTDSRGTNRNHTWTP